ncbi:MAG: DUF424 family protein [Thermoplasmata archaeon]
MIWIKVYTTQGEVVLAACDEDILGKIFEEGELQLPVLESFYGGEKVTHELFVKQLKTATIVNLTGREVISIASKMGMINEDCIIEIGGVPHAQIAKMI